MNKLSFLFSIALFAGCVTPFEARQTLPAFTATDIKKKSREIAECVSDQWGKTKPGMQFSSPAVSMSLIKNGYSIIATDYNLLGQANTMAVADIIEISNNSSVMFFTGPAASNMDGYEDAVKLCIE